MVGFAAVCVIVCVGRLCFDLGLVIGVLGCVSGCWR